MFKKAKTKIAALFTALPLWLAGVPCYAADWPVADMNIAIEQTNFQVNAGCSGTLIDLKQRLVLTAHHCIDDQYETVTREEVDEDGEVHTRKVRRLLPGNVSQYVFSGAERTVSTVYKTRLKAYDRDRDLAIVSIVADIPNLAAAPLACDAPIRGDKIYIVGNPLGVLYASVVTGIVSSVQRTYNTIGVDTNPNGPLMQVSGGTIGGNSGGAVYNAKGQLVGVPVRGSRVNEVLGFAVPLSDIKAFLADNHIDLGCQP